MPPVPATPRVPAASEECPEVPRGGPPVIGRPVEEFEPQPPSAGSGYRPDTVCDGWSTPALTVRLASVRGYQHRFEGRPREDDVAVGVDESTGTLAFAVADGVSAAREPHIGAVLASRTAVDDLLAQLAETGDPAGTDWRRTVSAAAWQLVMRVTGGSVPDADSRAEAERRLATTLVAGTVTPRPDGTLLARVVQVGDSAAWTLHGGVYTALFPVAGIAADVPDSNLVTPLPRVPDRVRPVVAAIGPEDALLIGTDGFGDALGDGTGPVGEFFRRGLNRPPRATALGGLLDFSRESFDDDRTLLVVWPRTALR